MRHGLLTLLLLLAAAVPRAARAQALSLARTRTLPTDSLYAVAQQPTLPDSSRWFALLTLSNRLYADGKPKALEVAHQAVVLAYKMKDASSTAKSLYNLAMFCQFFGDYVRAAEYYQQGANVAHENHLPSEFLFYSGLGMIADDTKDFRKGKTYFRRAYLALQTVPPGKATVREKGHTALNFANSFLHNGQYDSARWYSSEARNHYEKINELRGIGNVYELRANTFLATRPQTNAMLDSAAWNFSKSLAYAHQANTQGSVAIAAISLAEVYRLQGKAAASQQMAELGLALSRKLNWPVHQEQALRWLAWAYADQGNYRESYRLARVADSIQHTVLNTDKAKALAELQVKFDVRQQQQQVALLTQQNRAAAAQQQAQRASLELLTEQNRVSETEKQLLAQDKRIAEAASRAQQQSLELLTQRSHIAQAQAQTQQAQVQLLTQQNRAATAQQQAQQARLRAWVVGTGILAVALLAGTVLYLRLRRSRTQLAAANQEISQSVAEKEVLLQEIHHRVKNNLQLVNSLLAWQSSALPDPALVDVLQGSQARIQSMALVHEFLYRADNLAQVRLDSYLSELLDTLHRSYSSAQQPVAFTKELAPIVMEAKEAIPFGLLVNELVTNAYKHAFTGRTGGHVHVELTGTPAQFRLLVADDGRGLPDGAATKPNSGSLGMQLVNVLAKQLKATVTAALNQPAGTRFEVVRA